VSSKKNFKVQTDNLIPVDFVKNNNSTDLVFITNKGKVDFNRWNYLDRPKSDVLLLATFMSREQLVLDLFNAVNQLSHELSKTTVEFLASEGCKQLFQFFDHKYKQGKSAVISSINQITRSTIDEILTWLRNKPAKTETGKLSTLGARRHYTSIKTLLNYFVQQGRLSREIFPYSPFVNVNRSGKGTEAYSKSEYSRLIRFLWSQISSIRNNNFKGSYNQKLVTYALLIAAKTGRNTSSILNMQTDCIQPHPLVPDTHVLLTTYKNRGMNTSVQAMRNSYELEDVYAAHKDVTVLIKEVCDLTAPLRKNEIKNDLFITKSKKVICRLSEVIFWKSVQALYSKAGLIDDQGQELKFQVKRMRKTFGNRIWQLTGGDPVKTARIMGNTTPVLNTHYLDVTPEMERNHKYLGHVITQTLTGNKFDDQFKSSLSSALEIDVDSVNKILIGDFNTGVGRCSDPYTGRYSSSDDSACTRFLACFKCPNQVVLESDLHRLFSFYWLLVKERGFIGRRKWKKTYSWVIRVIEKEIEPIFCNDLVSEIKGRAKVQPHPMWVERMSLIAI